MESCLFCRFIAGGLPSSPVLDNDVVLAFLDIRPANPGHTLVVPRRHVESFTELSTIEVERLALWSQRIATALKRGFDTSSLAKWETASVGGQAVRFRIEKRWTGPRLS